MRTLKALHFSWFAMAIGAVLSFNSAKGQDYISNASSNLASGAAWIGGVVPGASDTATWSSGQTGVVNRNALNNYFTTSGNVTWGSIGVNNWTQFPGGAHIPININTTAPDTSNVITLTNASTPSGSNFALSVNKVIFNVANVAVGATSQKWQIASDYPINVNTDSSQPPVTITGALTATAGNSTLDLSGGGLLMLTGSSSPNGGSPSATHSSGTGSQLSLELDGSNIAFGGNNTSNFGSLILSPTVTPIGPGIQGYVGQQSLALGTGAGNGIPAITATSNIFFNGSVNPNYDPITNPGVAQYINAFQPGSNVLTVYGWQGQIGDTNVGGTGGTYGHLLFASATGDTSVLPTDGIVYSVIFDLSDNANGATSTTTNSVGGTFIPDFSADGLLANQDYGEWIASSIPGYFELVPYYGPVPEPKTILAGLALLGVLCWYERRRLNDLYGRYFVRAEESSL